MKFPQISEILSSICPLKVIATTEPLLSQIYIVQFCPRCQVPSNLSRTRGIMLEIMRGFLCHCLSVRGKSLVFLMFAICCYRIQVACRLSLHPLIQTVQTSICPHRGQRSGSGHRSNSSLWLERKDEFPEIRAAMKDEEKASELICLLLHQNCLGSLR